MTIQYMQLNGTLRKTISSSIPMKLSHIVRKQSKFHSIWQISSSMKQEKTNTSFQLKNWNKNISFTIIEPNLRGLIKISRNATFLIDTRQDGHHLWRFIERGVQVELRETSRLWNQYCTY